MDRREQSVRHLANLFTVIVGLGLSTAIYNLVDANGRVVIASTETIILCIAYAATLLPFYHGAMRHLDDRYTGSDTAHVRDGALLADFVILFVEGCWFIAIAVLVKRPVEYAQGFALLLVLDVLWGALALLAFSPKKPGLAESKWTIINFVTVIVLSVILYWHDIVPFLPRGRGPEDLLRFSVGIAFIAIVRTILDYWWAWDIYYPRERA